MWARSRKTYSRKGFFHFLIVWSFISSIVGLILFSNYFSLSRSTVDLTKNYFQSVSDILTVGFLVDNAKCRIPDLDAWNSGVLPLISDVPPFDCHDQPYFNLTYVANGGLIINEEVVKTNGYILEDVACCYRSIERVEQSRLNYDLDADNKYIYSETCFRMEKFTKPKAGFVKVTCKRNNVFGTVLYENYHLIAILPEEGDDDGSQLSRKLSFWRKYSKFSEQGNVEKVENVSESSYQHFSKVGKPPNILILGLDSTSRLNFRRFMNRTVKILEDVLKPVEMRGYTKVGENTFPNLVPLFTSFSEDELRKICYPNRWTPQDDCPYIWKLFADNNYLTGLLEDSPEYSIFNYLKTAFIKQPVDMYIRPFMLAVYKDFEENPPKSDCLRYQRPEEIIMNYIVDLASLADSRGIPYFIMSWMTDLTHDNMNNLQTADELFAERLLKLHARGLLENTILFIMGDHGYRFLDVRSTSSGWFEDKLPTLWIKLPEPVTDSNPSWLEALKYNSNQLITPFDIHEIFREVLNKYVIPGTPLLKGQNSSSLRGISPFVKVPPRTCEEAEIPAEFCSCVFPVEYKSNETFIRLAGEYVIQSINLRLPPVCKPFFAAVVTASGVFNSHVYNEQIQDGTSESDQFPELIIVAVRTDPGDFRFEAQVSYNRSTGEFDKVSNILRMNKITRSTICLRTEDKLSFEQLCYCGVWLG